VGDRKKKEQRNGIYPLFANWIREGNKFLKSAERSMKRQGVGTGGNWIKNFLLAKEGNR